MAKPDYDLRFYEEEDGSTPVHDWLLSLPPSQRRAVGSAMERILQRDGIGVCGTEFGKQLGAGLFEFRARISSDDVKRPPAPDEPQPWKMLVRVFCHAHGDRLILLLAGYDKQREPSKTRQQQEIALARARLQRWRQRQRPRKR
jgi:phage-related protein